MMKAKGRHPFKGKGKVKENSSVNIKCFGCGEAGHMKTECPNKKNDEHKGKKQFKKKAYIAWDDSDSNSESSDSKLKQTFA
ncbi:unnamed protein product [Sphenostylis stenocarpa]|uniref:CCHC-type domain-containing protein n=1 Tax=Sphenostylis stenocarpa TaxID=92480 RepID=A0AA86SXY7_9FABA|nr:unnamed protein product [Sphenostylis stenocarpa]